MRGIEFTMMDAYSFDISSENAELSYKKIYDAYIEIFKRLGLNVVAVAADSGTMGGKKSEEFMILSSLGEDTILYNEETNTGLNTEVLGKENHLEFLKTEYGIEDLSQFKEVRASELGHVFNLGTFYSDKMNLYFTDRDEQRKPVYMGCYGIGISRIVSIIYEMSILKEEDKIKGISLPLSVAPYITQIIYSENKKEEAHLLYKKLLAEKVPAILDNREDKKLGIGVKINDAKTLGTPFITILGDKIENNLIELEYVKTGEKFIMPKDKYIEILINIGENKSFNPVELKKYLA